MAYRNYLVKAGNYTIPQWFINMGSYSGYPNTLDVDSYRDGNGELRRDVLSHIAYKAEFETSVMTATQYAEVIANIRRNFLNKAERCVNATVFINETADYVTQKMYIPDTKPEILAEDNGDLVYSPVKIEFIGY